VTLRLPISTSLLLLAGLAAAQDTPLTASAPSPLGIRQQRVERMMADLEQKFKGLKLALLQTEPQRAERLQQTLNRAKELLIQKRMTDVTLLLDQAQLDTAEDGQKALLADLRDLLTLLLDEETAGEKASEEYDRLRELKQQIEKLIHGERAAKQATDRLATEPQASFETLARQQEDLARQAAALTHGSVPPPGQESLAAAAQSMNEASGSLRQQQPAAASLQQQDAIHSLLNALNEVQERQAELAGLAQAEKQARLEAQFREMLVTQQRLTGQTATLEKKRTDAGGQLARGDRNLVRSIGEEERRLEAIKSDTRSQDPGLAGKAQQAFDILQADGTSVVFPDLVEQLRDDLVHVGNLLADDLRTDQHTLSLQREIESTLAELIDALQQTQPEQAAAAAAGASGKSGQQPLLPNSAELKLLRAAQLQVNRQTTAFDQARPTAGPLHESQQIQMQKIAERQAKIAQMTAQILQRQP
jgi:hypothetical protein